MGFERPTVKSNEREKEKFMLEKREALDFIELLKRIKPEKLYIHYTGHWVSGYCYNFYFKVGWFKKYQTKICQGYDLDWHRHLAEERGEKNAAAETKLLALTKKSVKIKEAPKTFLSNEDVHDELYILENPADYLEIK